jgi:hypothetical protein
MLNPGAKNWLNKYLDLAESGAFTIGRKVCHGNTASECIHASVFSTGLVFGYPARFLFYHDDHEKWTLDERLKLLLFEHMLLDHLIYHDTDKLDRDMFVQDLIDFYSGYHTNSVLNVFRFFVKESHTIKLEQVFTRRVQIRKVYSQKFWVNYLCNSLVFLDVLAFRDFLKKGNTLAYNYTEYADGVLRTIILASRIDGSIDAQEKTIFDVFLASALIDDEQRTSYIHLLRDDIERTQRLDRIDRAQPLLYRLYLLDIAVLTIFSDLQALDVEMDFLEQLRIHLHLEEDHLDQSIALIQAFVIQHNHKVTFLQENSAYEKLFNSFSARWVKILGRNKDKLVAELSESKELIALVKKSLTQELSEDEKTKVSEQFKDIVKSMPALAIFMLPGGALLLPIILKIIPTLLPSAFRDND